MAGNRDFNINLKMRAEFAQAQAALRRAQGNIDKLGGALGRANKLGNTTRAVFTGVGIAAAAMAAAGAALMGKYIANTIEAEQVQAQLKASIKDTAGAAGRSLAELNAQAAKLQSTTVFDDESIGRAQAMLAIFTQIRGVNFDRTIEAATDLATKMGVDVADAAKTLGKALSDPEKGLGALRKAGVTFTDAQTEQIKKMMEAGKVAEAQSFILDKLQGTMGTAAEAARDTLGGALKALKVAFDNLLEGSSGDEGVKGTREAIESLIVTLNSPDTKNAITSIISGIVNVTNALARGIGWWVKWGEARRIAMNAGDITGASEVGAQKRLDEIANELNRMATAANDPIARAMGIAPAQGGREWNKLIAERDHIIEQLKTQNRDAQQAALASAGVAAAAFDFLGKPAGPAPEGQGVAHPSKASTAAKADPDADIKRRIEALREEAALLAAVKEGEEKAGEAAKAHYDITDGEFKNKSPQLKQQLQLAAEALDKKNADIAAEKKRTEAIKESQKAYDDLLGELRTPAEIAIDDAIEKVNALNKALTDGIALKQPYDESLARIASGMIAKQPDFQGLAPEVGGAGGELSKLDQAAADEEKWYQDSLARIEAFRQLKAENTAAADAEEERVEADHQSRMKAIKESQLRAQLDIAENFFGQIAQLQHSRNSKVAAVGKAAAIAQAIITTYKNANEAYGAFVSIPVVGPALAIAAAAAAVAAGLANVAQIRAQPTGYAAGGWTGPGSKYQPAGIVHADEGVLNKEEIAALGGPSGFYALRDAIDDGTMRAMLHGWAGYADGGIVASRPRLASPDFARFPQGSITVPASQIGLRLINQVDPALFGDYLDSPDSDRVFLNKISRNKSAVRALVT